MKKLITVFLLLFMQSSLAQKLPRSPPAGSKLHLELPAVVGIKADLPFGVPRGALGHWGVGNGGDWLRIGFARARDYAAQIVLRIKPDSLKNIPQAELRAWIIQNQKYLAADILQAEHHWELEARPTCAWTLSPSGADKVPTAYPIQFSYASCRENVDSFLKAAQLLIHEAVHHFNGDETMADQIAIGIVDAWQNGMMDALPLGLEQAPPGSFKHAAVWTGEKMVVYGGWQQEKSAAIATVSAYDPRSESWSDLKAPAELGARQDAQMIWTGSEIMIWGGFANQGAQQNEWVYSGALYHPERQSWEILSAPSWWSPKAFTWNADARQTLVWTGDKAIVYGGIDSRSLRPLAAIYDPKTRSWTRLNTDASEAPKRIAGHTAVWTGQHMLVWGGYQGDSDSEREISAEGALYTLATDSWTALKSEGAPSARAGHAAVWTGKQLLILSGGGVNSQGGLAATGGIYDLAKHSWTAIQSELLIERVGHKAVWNGEEMLLIGGRSNRLKSYFGELYAFNPETQRWRIVSAGKSPETRYFPSLVWTGSSALVWGGMGADSQSRRSGAMFFP